MRNHQAITIEEFNGLWKRGGVDSVPLDHFSDCNNIQYIESGFKTRYGLDTYQAIPNPVRMYEYNATSIGLEGLLILNNLGEIYHIVSGISFLVMTLSSMTDFGFVEISGRAYISPSSNQGLSGLQNEKIWVYKGDQNTPARVAAGVQPVDADGLIAAADGGSGDIEAGIHIIGVVYETDTGYLTAPGPDTLASYTAAGSKTADLTNVCVSPHAYVVKRHIVASRAIDPALYTGNLRGYDLFFVPDGIIPNNIDTTITIDFFDSELLEDASHLFDNFASIPAGGGLGQYHGRLVSWDEFDFPAIVRLSFPGEPEAISQVDGLIQIPFNGTGISHCHEYRDVLYICKVESTTATSDNGDVPSSWSTSVIDQGIGASKHGIAIIGEIGSINIEYLLVHNYSGIFVFNGTYSRPELSYKIKDLWLSYDQTEIGINAEFYNNVLNQLIYINIPSQNTILIGDYSNGMDFKSIKWGIWTFDISPITLALIGHDQKLLIGAPNAV